jgi:AraC-like DNA-binding protein
MVSQSATFSPVIRSYSRGHFVAAHAHPWPQLLYASSGILSVQTAKGSWIVPPQRAVWLPPDCVHETRMLTDVSFNSLYLQRSKQWSRYDCEVVEINPLVRELILTALKIGSDRQMTKREDLIVKLIVEELMIAKRGAWPIPLPQDRRLLSLCQKILEQPSLDRTLDHLASEIGSSSKTIARLFDRELGMSFRKWREQVQVANAVAHLVQGTPVKVVASLLGYTPSAFSVMMRRNAGTTPQSLRHQLMTDGFAASELGQAVH